MDGNKRSVARVDHAFKTRDSNDRHTADEACQLLGHAACEQSFGCTYHGV